MGECIEILEKEGVLDKELSDRLRSMIKFRNKLIHRYWEIEDQRVYEYAKKDIRDFIDFIEEIKRIFLNCFFLPLSHKFSQNINPFL